MEYRKETHFIVAYDGDKMRGKWDILTNEYVGIKGAIVKSKPQSFNNASINSMNPCFRSAYDMVIHSIGWSMDFTPEHGKRLEEIISVGLKVSSRWDAFWHLLDYKTKLTKDCVTFINDNFNGVYSEESMSAYNSYRKYKALVEKCGEQKTWAISVLNDVEKDVPIDFVEGMILRGIHEKLYYNDTSRYNTMPNFSRIINHWYTMIKAMGDKLEVKHNILSNYQILQWIYEEYKNEHYDENLKAHNDKAWLYFEDENYIVKPLLSRAEFHIEAEVQQNCVERMYMEQVANGNTHVVAVCKKDNPNTPYITCEVDNHGDIRQYLLRFNRYPTEQTDKDFRHTYQKHLTSSLKD